MAVSVTPQDVLYQIMFIDSLATCVLRNLRENTTDAAFVREFAQVCECQDFRCCGTLREGNLEPTFSQTTKALALINLGFLSQYLTSTVYPT